MSEERGPVPGSFSISSRLGGGGGKIRREFPSSTLTQYSRSSGTRVQIFYPAGRFEEITSEALFSRDLSAAGSEMEIRFFSTFQEFRNG